MYAGDIWLNFCMVHAVFEILINLGNTSQCQLTGVLEDTSTSSAQIKCLRGTTLCMTYAQRIKESEVAEKKNLKRKLKRKIAARWQLRKRG